jgi:serine/threonine protein kinase
VSVRIGDTVEHFLIVSLIGEGGMGQVYLARDSRLERSVALKIVHPDAAPSGTADAKSGGAARLIREARAAASLEHPNVVTIYEVGTIAGQGEDAGRPYIAMELIKGKPLRALIGDGTFPQAERLRWLVDVARALSAAHALGLVHRDVKPENVMVRDDGVVKVLDFGLAKRATSKASLSSSTEAQVLPSVTGAGVAVGTPYYMAPEQMRREPLDGRVDQFAWGVVAYELLSGIPPWGRDLDALELVSKLLTAHPRPLAEVCPEVPPHVSAVVARAMEKERGGRFPSMTELIAALTSEQAPRASAISPFAATERSKAPSSEAPRRSRRRSRAWLVAAASLASAAGLGFVVARSRPRVPTAAPGDASSTAVAAPVECTRATECVARLRGEPAVCNGAGRCAAVASPDCTALFEPEDLLHDDTIWIGTDFPANEELARDGELNENAVDLGRRDFAQAMQLVLSANRAAGGRRIAVAACKHTPARRGAGPHLVDDLGVPAVIGFGGGTDTLELTAGTFVPAGVLSLSSITISPLLASIPHAPEQPRLVWRTTYSANDAARALAAFTARLEARIGAQPGRFRVASIRARTASANAFAGTYFGALSFNRRSALANGDQYLESSYTTADEKAREIDRVVAFAPDVLVVATDRDVIPAVEARWHVGNRRPTYLVDTPINDELLQFIGTSRDRRARVFGVSSLSTTHTNARFVVHYNETYPTPVTRTQAPNSSYDAFYLVAFALLADADARPTGASLARTIAARLIPPGTRVELGPPGILTAFNALQGGGRLDLNGTTGPLDFDPATGEAPFDLALLCTKLDDRGAAVGSAESGLVYQTAAGRFEGEMRCP